MLNEEITVDFEDIKGVKVGYTADDDGNHETIAVIYIDKDRKFLGPASLVDIIEPHCHKYIFEKILEAIPDAVVARHEYLRESSR